MLRELREADIQAFRNALARLLEAEAVCFGCKMLRDGPWVDRMPALPICEMHQYRRHHLAFPP